MIGSKIILIIDDDEHFSFGLTAVLERAGFQVLTARSGSEGFISILEKRPDLVLCDIMMPPPDGINLKAILAGDPQTREIPFLFLTARTTQVDKLAGLGVGADDYITKPCNVSEILARIESVLRRYEWSSKIEDRPGPPAAHAWSGDESPFQTLGLEPGASRTEVVKAYRKKARLYQPDLVAGLAPEIQALAEKQMKSINAAFMLAVVKANQD